MDCGTVASRASAPAVLKAVTVASRASVPSDLKGGTVVSRASAPITMEELPEALEGNTVILNG